MTREVKMIKYNLWLNMTAMVIFTSFRFQTIAAGDSTSG